MSRRFLHPAILRQRRAQQQSGCDAAEEERFQQNAVVLLGLNEEFAPSVTDSRPRSNGWEVAGRLRKAHALVAVLRRCGVTVEQAAKFTAEQWVLTARAARVNVPSAETQRVAIEMLRREAA